jgi:hypothetical protein
MTTEWLKRLSIKAEKSHQENEEKEKTDFQLTVDLDSNSMAGVESSRLKLSRLRFNA